MIRKQVYLRADQDRRLKSLARRLGISEAELIRRSVDRAVLDATPLWPDLSAWEAELKFLGRRMAGRNLPGRRDWRREDLYEHRGLSRH